MTIELVASILTTDPALCHCNRSVVLMVRNHTIDMREDHDTACLKHIVRDDDIRGELEALHSFIGEALAFSKKAA